MGPAVSPQTAPPESPPVVVDESENGDWEQVKTKSRAKPLKVNSYSRQVASPTAPSTPRRRAEGSRSGHGGPVANGDISGGGKGREGGDRWRQEGGEWSSRPGGKQHSGPVWGARESGSGREEAAERGAEERTTKQMEVRENGGLDAGPAKPSEKKPGAQAGKEALLSSPREAGILGSGEQAEGKKEGVDTAATASGRPVDIAPKSPVKSSTFSYSAALKVGLPPPLQINTAGEKGLESAGEKNGERDSGNGSSAFPTLSKSNSKNERMQKTPKKEQGTAAVAAKAEDVNKKEDGKKGATKEGGRNAAEKEGVKTEGEIVEAGKKDGGKKQVDKKETEKKEGAEGEGSRKEGDRKETNKKGGEKRKGEKKDREKKDLPKSQSDPLPGPKVEGSESLASPEGKNEGSIESVPDQASDQSSPPKAEPVAVPEKPNPWGKLPAPVEAVSLAEVQQEEEKGSKAALANVARKDAQAKGRREDSAESAKDSGAVQDGGEKREAARPVGRGWEARKPDAPPRVTQVQAPPLGGVASTPAMRQKSPPLVQRQQQFPTLPSRRGEQVPVTDLSALPPSAPERIQQRSMGNIGGGLVRNRTPPLSHQAQRPQPVQLPPPIQGLNAGARISPTATPYTPNSAAFTPTAPQYTPTGRISPGLRSYGQPMAVLQAPPGMFVQQQSDGSLAYVPQPMNEQSWRLPGGRNPPPLRTNGGPAMVYSPTTPPDYGYALAALSPTSQPGTPLGSPAVPMIFGGGQLPPPPAELLANADALHWEVLQYAQKARRTPEARARAESAVLCVRRAIQALWPASNVEIFGSFSTGLCLPHSDVDLAVVGAPPPPPELANIPGGRPLVPLIRELAAVLKTSPWLDTLTTIETASMPVIKLRCKPSLEESSRSGGSEEAKVEGGESEGSGKAESADKGRSSVEESGAKESVAMDDVSKPVSDDVSKRVLDDVSRRVSDDVSRRVSDDVSRRVSDSPAVAIDITIMSRRGQPMGKDRKEGPPPKSQHNGASARQFVIERLQKLPALAPLVLLLKSYLHHRGLNDVYTGGLGSFSLTLMLVFYLERVATTPMEKLPSPGGPISGNDAPVNGNGLSGTSSTATRQVQEPTTKPEAESSSTPETSSSQKEEHSVSSEVESGTSMKAFSEDESEGVKPEGGDAEDIHPDKSGGGTSIAGGVEETPTVVGMTEPVDWLAAGPMPNLGKLLIGFLQLFGNELDLATVRLVLKNNGQNGGIFYHDKHTRPVALWIDDPLRPGANIGAGSFAMYNVQAALREMLKIISAPRELPSDQDSTPSLIEQLFSQVYPEQNPV